MATKLAEITLPDGRVAEIEGDEKNIMEFLNSLPDVNANQKAQGIQTAQAQPVQQNPNMGPIDRLKAMEQRASEIAPRRSFGRDVSGVASGMTLGLARPTIQAVTGKDIGEGSLGGRIVGSILPVARVGQGIRATLNAPKLVKAAAAFAGEGIAGALAVSPEKDFKTFRDSLAQKAMTGALTGVATGAVLSSAGTALSAIPKGSKEAAYRTVNSLIKPLTKNFSYAKNPGRGIVEEGIVANSLDDLSDKVISAETRVWNELSQKVQTSKATIDLSDITNPIDDEIARLSRTPKTNSALIKRLNDTKDDLLGSLRIQGGTIRTKLQSLKSSTAQKALELKQAIGDVTKWTGNQSDDNAVNGALKKVYGKVKEKVNNAVPDSKELNERLADLISAKSAIKYRSVLNQRQNLIGLAPKIGGYVGAIATGASAGGPMGGIVAPSILYGAEKLLGSTASKTRIAKMLYNAGKAKLPISSSQARRVILPSLESALIKREK